MSLGEVAITGRSKEGATISGRPHWGAAFTGRSHWGVALPGRSHGRHGEASVPSQVGLMDELLSKLHVELMGDLLSQVNL
jgi:hypothetical protein